MTELKQILHRMRSESFSIFSLNGNIENRYFIIALILIIAYIMIFAVTGNMRIHDNMDSNVVWAKMFFEGQRFAAFLNGENHLPREGLSNFLHLKFSHHLFIVFGYKWGIIVCKFLMALTAFGGMFALLKKHFLTDKDQELAAFGAALGFALLPFWSFTWMLAGLPFMMYALLNIRQGSANRSDWVILIVLSFLGTLILTGIFLLIVFSALLVVDIVKKNRAFAVRLFLALAVTSLAYSAANYQLFSKFFMDKSFTSVRLEFSAGALWETCISRFFNGLLDGHYRHAASLHKYLILPLVLLTFFIKLYDKVRSLSFFKKEHVNVKLSKVYWLLLLYIILSSVFYGFEWYKEFKSFFGAITRVLPVNWYRVVFLNAVFWYILFFLSLSFLIKRLKVFKSAAVIVVAVQIVIAFAHHESLYQHIDNHPIANFEGFYAEKQFEKIKRFIGKDPWEYRTASLGIYPAVAQYNGMYTIDGYSVNYPLEYKHKFRKIIDKELKKDKKHKSYFTQRGVRCYLFVSQLPYRNSMYLEHYFSGNNKEIVEPSLNYKLLRQMNVQYLLSAVKIKKPTKTRLLKKFSDPESIWDIYLYEVKDTKEKDQGQIR